MNLLDYIPEALAEWKEQLISDHERWGDVWKERSREGQEERIMQRFEDYFFEHVSFGTPIPWLKIMGLALIGWVREKHPDYASK